MITPQKSIPVERKSLKQVIGWPSKSGLEEFKGYLDRMRFLFFVYGVVLLVYLVAFVIFKCPVIDALSFVFGSGFGVSFSASVFEDLMMFIFLTLAVSIISIKMSTRNPEDHEFDSRIRAIMNSSNVKNNFRVFDFLKSQISTLLAYNKLIIYELHVNDYYPDTQTFYLTVRRVQIMTNMCKDRDFETKNRNIKIKPDTDHNKSFGKIKFLGFVDPITFQSTGKPKIDHTQDFPLTDASEKTIELPYSIKHDSELGVELIYEVYSKVAPPNLADSWSFCGVSRFTSQIQFRVFNNLKDGTNLKIDVKRIDAKGEDSHIDKEVLIILGLPYEHITETSLLPDEKLWYYLKPHRPLLIES